MNYLDLTQKIINIFYKYFGDKGFIINMQIWVNTKRNAKDIADPKTLNEEGWAQ